ncbi:transcription factor bHLH25-like [Gastrolobium bilobum]|uniref:transcription factor bHLH25-like n=1 Tax=Gastrolobium bilobum TaxID=150636 RepID=UPI002AB05A90|nr:transcription factor bHLH25-like [Gastrolobium bilobum]
MDDCWENLFSDLDMNNDNSFNQWQTNSFLNFEEHLTQQPSFSTQTHLKEVYNLEQLGQSWPHLSSKRTLNFESSVSQGTKRARSSSETHDHIMSERKRRQEMAEKFIALSSIIPGLKKIDKATVLGEAINYVKQLQERIAMLEQESKKKSSNSMIFIKKSISHPSCSHDYWEPNQVLPEVEARGIELEKELLIRIHCEKRKGILLKLLTLLKNIHLSIASSSVLPFGKNTLNITIIAQMGKEYNMTEDELVKNLRKELLKLYDM